MTVPEQTYPHIDGDGYVQVDEFTAFSATEALALGAFIQQQREKLEQVARAGRTGRGFALLSSLVNNGAPTPYVVTVDQYDGAVDVVFRSNEEGAAAFQDWAKRLGSFPNLVESTSNERTVLEVDGLRVESPRQAVVETAAVTA